MACAQRGGGFCSGHARRSHRSGRGGAGPGRRKRWRPAVFAALAEGHTLHFTLDGAPFGAEQYFDGRRSLWRFEDGRCEAGSWTAEADLVCFRYGDGMPAQCWRFRAGPERVAAALVEGGAETGLTLRMSRRDAAPLDCPGPDVGS